MTDILLDSATVRRRQRGFTLIELMITVIVLAIVASVAFPGFQRLAENNRVTAETNKLLSAFKLARSEAIRLAAPVTLVAIDGDFENGWCVYEGTVGDSCNANRRLRTFEGVSNVDWNDGGVTAVEFDRRGRREAPAPGNAVLIRVSPPDCVNDQGRQRQITVSAGGRASSQRGDC